MALEVGLITERKIWEDFVHEQPYTLFVQSWNYGEFYRSLGEDFWVAGVYDGSKLVGGSLVVTVHARRGNFLYLPYGPLIADSNSVAPALKALSAYLRERARADGYDFIRISPFYDDTHENRAMFKELGFRNAPMHILAEHTWLLDLSPSEEELLRGMEKNHRSLIKRCQNEGVRVEHAQDKEAVDQFNRLLDITVMRHKFFRFSDSYIHKEFAAFAEHNETLVFKALLPDGTLDASGVFMYYGNMAAYRHGASLMSNKRLPSSYLMQWEAIREAKRRGLQWYNFWGIAPEGAPASHPFKGITHFKKGFGGFGKNLLHCQDLPVTWRYSINWLVERFRSLKRGFT